MANSGASALEGQAQNLEALRIGTSELSSFTSLIFRHLIVPDSSIALFAVAAIFVFGVLYYLPSGRFIRPHPLFWRLVFAHGVLYEIALLYLLSLSRDDARHLMTLFDSSLNQPLQERSYAANCQLDWEVLKKALLDIYVLSHIAGWTFITWMIRDRVTVWLMSMQWELIEMCFVWCMPHFDECVWDSLGMDLLFCNALGIELGLFIIRRFKIKPYNWHECGFSANSVDQTANSQWPITDVLLRYVLQHGAMLTIHIVQLNAFLLKQVLWIPKENPVNAYRMVLIWTLIGFPPIREAFDWASERKRPGAFMLLWAALLLTEVACVVKLVRGTIDKPMPERTFYASIAVVCLYFICHGAYFYRSQRKAWLAQQQQHALTDRDKDKDKAAAVQDHAHLNGKANGTGKHKGVKHD